MCYLNGPGCHNTLLRNRNMQQFYLYVSILLNRLHSCNSNIFLPRNNDEQCCDYASFSRDGDENFLVLGQFGDKPRSVDKNTSISEASF